MSGNEWEAEPIGHVIRRAREQFGLTQNELADALNATSGNVGATRHEVSRWERGDRIPDPHTRAYLSEVLGIPLELLDRAAALAKAQRLLGGVRKWHRGQ